MAQPNTTPVGAPIDTYALGNTYATNVAERGKGGYQCMADITARDAITTERRTEGMVVYVISTALEYRLEADLTTWTEITTGAPPADVMLKSVYDINGNNIVDNSDALQGATLVQVRDRATHTGAQAIATVTGLQAALDAKVDDSQSGQPLGFAPLNGSGIIDPIYLGAIASPIDPVLPWNVITNTPTLADGGVFTAGEAYIVTTSANPTARDLGSGSEDWSDGDIAIYTATNIFIRVPRSGVGVSQITTQSGTFTGSVSLLTTAHFNNSTNKNMVSDLILAAANAADTPSASNPFATMDDVADALTISSGIFSPDLFADGQVLGTGTLRLLNTLTSPATGVNYTNVSAGNAWPRVNAAYTIDVTTMSIDWIVFQEACLTMEALGYAKMTVTGGKGYCFSQTVVLPQNQLNIIYNKRGFIYTFDFGGANFVNLTATNFPMFTRYPVNQAAIVDNLYYFYVFTNASATGRGTTNIDDCFIKLGATSHSYFAHMRLNSFGCGINCEFGLEVSFFNILCNDYGLYGLRAANGTWSGAGFGNAQSNCVKMDQVHCYNGVGKTPVAGIYMNGNHNNKIGTATFEGQNGAQHHILWESLGGTISNNLLVIENLYVEGAVVTRAVVRAKGRKGCVRVSDFRCTVTHPAFLELYHYTVAELNILTPGDTGVVPMYAYIQYGPQNVVIGSPLSNVHRTGISHFWIVEWCLMANNSILSNAANFEQINGTLPPTANTRFTPTPT